MMLTCREATRLLASEQLEGAPLARKILMRLHLLVCEDCRRYAKELDAMGETAREAFRLPLDPAKLAELERVILERSSLEGRSGSA